MLRITLVWPPAVLSGHAKGKHYHTRARATKNHRKWGATATQEALQGQKPCLPAEGDIGLHIRFVPPHRLGDRTNYPNRCKPGIDGIADALGVNDRRFLPSYEYAEPQKPGWIEVTVALP